MNNDKSSKSPSPASSELASAGVEKRQQIAHESDPGKEKRQQISADVPQRRRRGRVPYRHDWAKVMQDWERYRNRIWSLDRPKLRDFCRTQGISERSFRYIRSKRRA